MLDVKEQSHDNCASSRSCHMDDVASSTGPSVKALHLSRTALGAMSYATEFKKAEKGSLCLDWNLVLAELSRRFFVGAGLGHLSCIWENY